MNIEELREFCLSLPGATEDVKWESDLCFCVGEKMFCVTGLKSEVFRFTCKVTAEEFDELVQQSGVEPAAYVARYKWVSFKEPELWTDTELRQYIKQSYQLVRNKLPKTLRDSLK